MPLAQTSRRAAQLESPIREGKNEFCLWPVPDGTLRPHTLRWHLSADLPLTIKPTLRAIQKISTWEISADRHPPKDRFPDAPLLVHPRPHRSQQSGAPVHNPRGTITPIHDPAPTRQMAQTGTNAVLGIVPFWTGDDSGRTLKCGQRDHHLLSGIKTSPDQRFFHHVFELLGR